MELVAGSSVIYHLLYDCTELIGFYLLVLILPSKLHHIEEQRHFNLGKGFVFEEQTLRACT